MGPPSGQFPIVQPHPAGRPTPPTDPAKLARRRQRIKQFLLVFGVLAVVVVLVGGVAGYFYYDKATAPDRSTPGVVVREYLTATFAKSASPASDFTCGYPDEITEIQQLVTTVEGLETQYHVDVTVDWADFRTTVVGKKATVDAKLIVQVPEKNGSVSESRDPWQFSLEDRSGWRVCAAHKVP
jgi:hypothetical protein